MKIYVSEKDKDRALTDLSYDIYMAIKKAQISRLDEIQNMPAHWHASFVEEVDKMYKASNVAELEPFLDITYVPEKLTFFTFNNLRFQQDGVPSEVKRFDTLQEALREYNSLPKEYTTALGVTLNERSELDLVHRVNGESVMVADWKNIEQYANNPLIHQAINCLVVHLNIQYELNSGIFNSSRSKIDLNGELERKFDFHYLNSSVLTPIQRTSEISSHLKDKYLRAEKGVGNLLSSINEVYVEGDGWVNGKEFLRKLNELDLYRDSKRYKVDTLNVNYVDINGRCGQVDISPRDFELVRNQTIERSAKHPEIDSQIKDAAAKVDNKTIDGSTAHERDDR